MSKTAVCTAQEALERLKAGNQRYLSAERGLGDVSPAARRRSCEQGQAPYAIIVTCSDSRVIPEHVFSAGIGELFVIRVAGNVIGDYELGSIQYAAGHLGCPLTVVMSHDHCGAVGAALGREAEGFIRTITDEIRKAIGDERDEYRACCLNVDHSVETIRARLGVPVRGAVYHLEDGSVEFL